MYRNSLSLITSLGLLLIPASIYLGGCSSETSKGAAQLTQPATQPATNRPLSPEQLQQIASSITC